MRRKSFWTLGLVACLGFAIAGFADHKPGHKKPGGGGGGSIPLTVTFRDCTGSAFGDGLEDEPCPGEGFNFFKDRIKSDSMGPYSDKVDNVGTSIDTQGQFALRLGSGSKRNQPVIRTLFLDFSDCVSVPEECNPPFVRGSTTGSWFTSGVNLREMGIPETRGDLRLKMTLKPVDSEFSWKLHFDPLDLDCPGSSTITVSRVDADTWEIKAGQDAVACLERRSDVRGVDFEFKGLYHMPFKILVQKK